MSGQGTSDYRPQGDGPHSTLAGNLYDPNVNADGAKGGRGVGGTSESTIRDEAQEHIGSRGQGNTGHAYDSGSGSFGRNEPSAGQQHSEGIQHIKHASGAGTGSSSLSGSGPTSIAGQGSSGYSGTDSTTGTGTYTGNESDLATGQYNQGANTGSTNSQPGLFARGAAALGLGGNTASQGTTTSDSTTNNSIDRNPQSTTGTSELASHSRSAEVPGSTSTGNALGRDALSSTSGENYTGAQSSTLGRDQVSSTSGENYTGAQSSTVGRDQTSATSGEHLTGAHSSALGRDEHSTTSGEHLTGAHSSIPGSSSSHATDTTGTGSSTHGSTTESTRNPGSSSTGEALPKAAPGAETDRNQSGPPPSIPTAGGERIGTKHWGESKVIPDNPPRRESESKGVSSAEGQSDDLTKQNTETNASGAEHKESFLEKVKDKLHSKK